jgi:hypothetical protein
MFFEMLIKTVFLRILGYARKENKAEKAVHQFQS